jgi:hypothetical protein
MGIMPSAAVVPPAMELVAAVLRTWTINVAIAREPPFRAVPQTCPRR